MTATAACDIVTHAGAHFFCKQLSERGFETTASLPPKILIAGCGAGHEAVAIAEYFSTVTDAIDLDLRVAPELEFIPQTRFQAASICDTPFQDESFDAVFYHHVIEHVDNPIASLVEINRILKSGGWLFIGTPNRHRLISSVGAHRQTDWDATISNKLKDNIRDWSARCTGRFRNELGAHAGFSKRELDKMLAVHFHQRHWLTADYLRFKYADHSLQSAIKVATNPALSWFAAPSIYVLATKA
jgi:SAM-dependent methyltransferase